MGKPLRRTFTGIAVLVLLGLTLVLSYPLWDGFGPWLPLPQEPAPLSSALSDTLFAEAGEGVLRALAEHRQDHGFPGITAAVAIGGEVVWSGAAGWADLETRTPASPGTVLRIGSTSKAVTATAVARLVDGGGISLEDSLSAFSDSWPNPAWNRLTLRQLLSHTAGFPEYEGNRDLFGAFLTLCGCRHYSSVRESLEIFDGTSLRYEPGTDFRYSSFDVNLVGAALSASQGEPYLDVLDRLVFEPLGLTSAGGAQDGTIRPALATFYETDGERARTWRPFDLSQRWPAGGLVATSEELALIGGAWMDPDFIRPETRGAMWTPQLLSNGQVNEQSYALGWRFYRDALHPGDSTRVLPFAHHGGVSKGAMSWLVVYPAYHLSIAVNINTRADTFAEFAEVEDEIAALFLERMEELGPGPWPPSEVGRPSESLTGSDPGTRG